MDENEIRKEWEAGRLEKLKVDQMKVRGVLRLCLFFFVEGADGRMNVHVLYRRSSSGQRAYPSQERKQT